MVGGLIQYILENNICLKPPTSINKNMLVVDQPFHILIYTDDISTHFELLKSLENQLLIDEILSIMENMIKSSVRPGGH